MPKKFKHCIVLQPGEPEIKSEYYLKDNPELCTDHKQLSIGQRVYIVDTNYIDNYTNQHAKIPCECIFIEKDPKYPRCLWYYFRTVADEELNTLRDPKFPNLYYKILESTSPYIIIP